MEFNIRGILNENGQLQSVQSSCSHTPTDGHPIGSPFHLEGPEIRESKVVNYAVKKDLDRKLNAKVDEMSQMILQLSLQEENLKMAKKLIKEYKDKLKRFRHENRQLKEANARLTKLLKENGISVPEGDSLTNDLWSNTVPKTEFMSSYTSESSTGSGETRPKIIRSSMTEVTIGFRHSLIDMTDSLYSVPAKLDDDSKQSAVYKETKTDLVNSTDTPSQFSKILVSSYTKGDRPNTLDVPKINVDKDSDTSGHCSRMVHYSDSKLPQYDHRSTENEKPARSKQVMNNMNAGQSLGANLSTIHNKAKGENGELSDDFLLDNESFQSAQYVSHQREEPPTEADEETFTKNSGLLCDEDGYLVLMVPTNRRLLNRNKAMRRADTKTPECSGTDVSVEASDRCSCCQCHVDNAVHVSWIDFHKCRNSSCQSTDTPNEIHATGRSVDLTQYDLDRPSTFDPFPEMETFQFEAQSMVNTSKHDYAVIPDSFDEVFHQGDQTVPDNDAVVKDIDKDKNDVCVTRAPLPLPREIDMTDGDHVTRRSSNCLPRPSSTDVYAPYSRNSGPYNWSTKLEDQPDIIMKMMRKTSEWNTAKKILLEKSHTCTSQDAENTLGTVVKKTIECYQKEFERRPGRNSKNLSDRIIKMVRDSLDNKYDDDVVTPQFLEKCVQICELRIGTCLKD